MSVRMNPCTKQKIIAVCLEDLTVKDSFVCMINTVIKYIKEYVFAWRRTNTMGMNKILQSHFGVV